MTAIGLDWLGGMGRKILGYKVKASLNQLHIFVSEPSPQMLRRLSKQIEVLPHGCIYICCSYISFLSICYITILAIF